MSQKNREEIDKISKEKVQKVFGILDEKIEFSQEGKLEDSFKKLESDFEYVHKIYLIIN